MRRQPARVPIPPVRTHVVRLGTVAGGTLSSIAVAGGTEDMVTVIGGADELFEALMDIVSAIVDPCVVAFPPVPEGQSLSYDSIDLFVCDGVGAQVSTFRVDEESECGEAGSYTIERHGAVYEAHACPSTCNVIEETGAAVYPAVECTR